MDRINVLENIPYDPAAFGRRKLVDRPELLVMQVALLPGQAIPTHPTNAQVHLLLLEGRLVATLDGQESTLERGDLVPIPEGTPMSLRPEGEAPATFTLWKTPNPNWAQ